MRADVCVIGAGPAGLSAAIAARQNGAQEVIVIDREDTGGGILRQCIHTGFGLKIFGEELTGPEYAARLCDRADKLGVKLLKSTMVMGISRDRKVTVSGSETGLKEIKANAVVIATGCRERSAGALMLPGDRPSGVMTAGVAQYFVNMEGYLPGREAVILGSGDIGLIMARRMTLEGANVKAVLEIMPYPGGLIRNIVQCLDDFGIPLRLSHTVTKIHGSRRLLGITVSKVDERLKTVEGTEEYIPCDTLLLSVGLIPENELSRALGVMIDPVTGGPVVYSDMQTTVAGVFACGNAVQVHDLADNASEEAARAGESAAMFKEPSEKKYYNTVAGGGVRHVVPQRLLGDGKDKTLYFRVTGLYKDCLTAARCGGKVIAKRKRARCAPGEMEEIVIKGADITADVEISVEGQR